jgi:hypothetical protein
VVFHYSIRNHPVDSSNFFDNSQTLDDNTDRAFYYTRFFVKSAYSFYLIYQ